MNLVFHALSFFKVNHIKLSRPTDYINWFVPFTTTIDYNVCTRPSAGRWKHKAG